MAIRTASSSAIAPAIVPAIRAAASMPRIDLLVLQPSAFCNIDCDYCYLPDRGNRRRMSLDTLERALDRVFGSDMLGGHLSIVWHAGEPLAVPRRFYDQAFAVIDRLRPAGLSVSHAMQTNATLLDADWAAFIRAHNIQIGVSLDGPQALHDAHRRTRTGGGTFDRTMAGVRVLQAAGIPFHVIAVLSADSLGHAAEIHDFFAAHGIRQVGFNYDEQDGAQRRSSMDFAGAEAAYGAFLGHFLDRALAAPGSAIVVRELAGAAAAIAGPPDVQAANHQADAFGILCVDVDGNVSTFSPELLGLRDARLGDFIIGNVHRDSLQDMTAQPYLHALQREIDAGVAACRRDCPCFRFCGGGAPANKLAETGRLDVTETLYCRLTKKAVLETVLGALETRLGFADPAGGSCGRDD
ncbi:cyclophane-forming radical SAM/SPASM peptide maturase GrrM/OscB [Ferrovibrio sp.]|uniref:cyclophane-forming radical SAM/SPASM peptide maturase GrrM/OscB n=1 Tax=Ferrovibrio sp. TaxID=1917215 RepID=UPI003120553C